MRKIMKISMLIASLLILVGAIIFTAAMSVYGWDFMKLSTVKYEDNTYIFEESIEKISLISDTTDIKILRSTDGKTKIVTHLPKAENHTVTLSEGTLVLEQKTDFSWKMLIGIDFNRPKITVYLPDEKYESLNIKSHTSDIRIAEGFSFDTVSVKLTTGDVYVKSVTAVNIQITTTTGDIKLINAECAENIKAKVSTGDIELTNVTCKDLIVNGDTGDVELKNVIASGKFDIETDTGDVELKGADASEIFIETDTGDVEGTLLTEKVFIARTDTGDINVPKTTTGGKCEIKTDTGDIKIKIK